LASGNASSVLGGTGNTAAGYGSVALGVAGTVMDDFAAVLAFADPASQNNSCSSAGAGSLQICSSAGLFVSGGLYVTCLLVVVDAHHCDATLF